MLVDVRLVDVRLVDIRLVDVRLVDVRLVVGMAVGASVGVAVVFINSLKSSRQRSENPNPERNEVV